MMIGRSSLAIWRCHWVQQSCLSCAAVIAGTAASGLDMLVLLAATATTVSQAITWCLAVLAAHPDIQQKVVDELTAVGLAPAGKAEFCLHTLLS